MQPDETVSESTTNTSLSSPVTGIGLRWITRFLIALFFSLFLGGLPVFIHHETRRLSSLKTELRQISELNETLAVRLEDSAIRLRSLKTPAGSSRILREKGYLPPGARVYQLEVMEPTRTGNR